MSVSDRAIVLLAHGSPDPRHQRGVEQLAIRVRALVSQGGSQEHVLSLFLDHNSPTPSDAAESIARLGIREAAVVPLLVSVGFHSRVDVPSTLKQLHERAPGCVVTLSRPFATDPHFVAAIEELLNASESRSTASDGLLLVGAGSRHPDAMATLSRAAEELATARGVPVIPAFVDAPPSVPTAHAALLANSGGARIQAVSVVIADGVLRDRISAAVGDVGAHLVPGTLVDTEALAEFALGQ